MDKFKTFAIRSVFGMLALASSCAFLTAQQTATITGSILDQAGKSLEGATVNVKGPTAKAATSAADGHFSVPELTPGVYNIDAIS